MVGLHGDIEEERTEKQVLSGRRGRPRIKSLQAVQWGLSEMTGKEKQQVNRSGEESVTYFARRADNLLYTKALKNLIDKEITDKQKQE